ncbi:fungal-specific transcription factor domain-containing protein [Apiospora hydei]|uniref:Fungal-specific transcription factor domain-containing protein n=1 Tax=Apiospora hydei TaxID=1337664 RepID=A0ABR1XBH0_9PEZI
MATLDSASRRVEKRNRPPVSCEPCRTRKLKCNRSSPCDACAKRGKSTACVYAPNAGRARSEPNRHRDMKDRLNNLERLVSSLLTGEAPVRTGPSAAGGNRNNGMDSENIPTLANTPLSERHGQPIAPLSPETPNFQKTGDGQLNYIDPSHWLSILDDTKEVREHLSVPNQPMAHSIKALDANHMTPDTGYLSTPSQGFSLGDALSALPTRPQYIAFWESPSTASPLWVALLFSILSIAACLRQISNITEPEGSLPPISILQQTTVQCLVLGRYITANAYALEAFMLHLQSGLFSPDRPPLDLWFEMGTVIRLAFRMGYHRDPNKLAGISPYDVQVDALMSYHNGYPSMVPSEYCDTDVPRNLENSDLRVDMTALPPSRPLNEQTPVLYIIVKAGVMAVFKRIVAHTQTVSAKPYAQTLLLDNEMNQAYSAVPDLLKRRDVKQSFLDHAVLIWQRCTIELLHLKGLIILHRRYINYEQQSPDFEPSRRACVKAALEMLARQAEVHQACEPGGWLYEDRWIFAVLPVHDFLLAAMVVCLDVSVRMRSKSQQRAASETEYRELVSKEFRALFDSQRIWAASSDASHEANVAALALDLMVQKVAETDTELFLGHYIPFDHVGFSPDPELFYGDAVIQMIEGSEIIDWNMDPSTLNATV